MQESRGMIFLPDPLAGDRRFTGLVSQMQKEFQDTQTLIFDEDGRFPDLEDMTRSRGYSAGRIGGRGHTDILSGLRAALQHMRGLCAQVYIAAEGSMAGAAVSVAAQLPVDGILLFDSRIFAPCGYGGISRQVSRINAFARRNLSLVVADAVLVDCGEAELRRLLRCMVNCGVHVLCSDGIKVENLWQKDQFCMHNAPGGFKLPMWR